MFIIRRTLENLLGGAMAQEMAVHQPMVREIVVLRATVQWAMAKTNIHLTRLQKSILVNHSIA